MKPILGVFALLLSSSVFASNSYLVNGSAETGIVLIGDTGKDNAGQLAVSRSMETLCAQENCNLGMLAGDNVYPVGLSHENDPVLERMFDKYYNPLNIPFLVTLGNHDYGKLSNDWKRGAWQLQHAKKNPNFYIPSYYYIYETDEAVFAVIDTSRLMWRKETFTQGGMVQAAHTLALLKNKWFIVMGHHPYLSNGQHGNAGNYERLPFPYMVSGTNVKAFMKAYVCGKAHFYFAGHEHLLQVFDGNIAGCNTQLVVSGTGASSTKLFKRNASLFETTQLGFFHVSIKSDSVRLRAINKDSEILFEKTYNK